MRRHARWMQLESAMGYFGLLAVIVTGCEECGGGGGSAGTKLSGEACEASDECVAGLVCAGNGTCLAAGLPGTAASGDDCVSSEYCQIGLKCSADGTCAPEGDPGTAGQGDDCIDTNDCELGLSCIEGGCYGFPIPLWLGVECEEDEGAYRAYFEVPGDQPSADFYRFPFPNDARIENGTLDMSGHPTPGVLIPALGDVVQEVVDLLANDFEGFGNNQAVFFRMSDHADYDELVINLPADGGNLAVIDITEGTPEYGTLASHGYRAATASRAYICDDWLSMHPSPGRPWAPGHTFAAVITTGAVDKSGNPLGQDADFTPMLSASAPSDGRLANAHAAYAPFRQWLTDSGTSPSSIAVASVFTVQDPTLPMELVRQGVMDAHIAVDTGVILCDGPVGPYADPDDVERGCPPVDSAFHEIQGLLSLPQFQQGIPPFKDAGDGGRIDVTEVPTPTRTDDVTFALTIPKGAAMPAGGWPLVIYGHGTNGNYRSFVADGTAGDLTDITTGDGTHVNFAVLSIDAVNHGARRHEENWKQSWLDLDPSAYDPDVLYFNPINPVAARDNALQAAADGWAMVRWVQALDWAAGDSPTGEAIHFDLDQIYYFGHSQGSTTGVAMVAFEPEFEAAVFSGAGGLLIESLLGKVNPFDIPSAIKVGIADPDLDRWHPLLNIAQAAAERSDPVNFGRKIAYVPFDGMEKRHVLQIYGIGDTYTPDLTQDALVRALGVDQITNGNTPLAYVNTVSPPVTANRSGTHTAVMSMFEAPGTNDAHFVIFDRDDAEKQYVQFLGTAVRDGVPTVVAP